MLSLCSQKNLLWEGRGWFENMDVQGVAKLCFTISLQGQSSSEIWNHHSFSQWSNLFTHYFPAFLNSFAYSHVPLELKGEGLKWYFQVSESGNLIMPPPLWRRVSQSFCSSFKLILLFPWSPALSCLLSQAGKVGKAFKYFQFSKTPCSVPHTTIFQEQKSFIMFLQLLLINLFVSLMSISVTSWQGKGERP